MYYIDRPRVPESHDTCAFHLFSGQPIGELFSFPRRKVGEIFFLDFARASPGSLMVRPLIIFHKSASRFSIKRILIPQYHVLKID